MNEPENLGTRPRELLLSVLVFNPKRGWLISGVYDVGRGEG
jgi:hypothetical protein